MPRLLRNSDYFKLIQEDNLKQVINNDFRFVLEVEQAAQAEMISYMVQRYLTDKIFTDTQLYDNSGTYYGKNLVEYTVAPFDYSIIYDIGDRVLWEDKIYFVNNPTAYAGVTPDDLDVWEYMVDDKSLFYVKLNQPEWNIKAKYVVGNIVWYNNYNYTVLKDNVAKVPDENPEFWLQGSEYSVNGIDPLEPTVWTKGDNRNQQIVMYLIDITLYHLHARINPRNIPELRMIRYDGMNATQNGGAIAWLKKVADGYVTADLPHLIPSDGLSIQWGSLDKNNNDY